jgi:hypothetical protein
MEDESFLSWQARHDKHFHNVRSLARVAIVAAPKSVTIYDAPTNEDKVDSIQGMYAVLAEARIPFDFLHEENLTEDRMSRYAGLILPNVALLSDAIGSVALGTDRSRGPVLLMPNTSPKVKSARGLPACYGSSARY